MEDWYLFKWIVNRQGVLWQRLVIRSIAFHDLYYIFLYVIAAIKNLFERTLLIGLFLKRAIINFKYIRYFSPFFLGSFKLAVGTYMFINRLVSSIPLRLFSKRTWKNPLPFYSCVFLFARLNTNLCLTLAWEKQRMWFYWGLLKHTREQKPHDAVYKKSNNISAVKK